MSESLGEGSGCNCGSNCGCKLLEKDKLLSSKRLSDNGVELLYEASENTIYPASGTFYHQRIQTEILLRILDKLNE